MKILIVENEIYLAQSISSKLSFFGFNCDMASSIQEAMQHDKIDIVLLSTNISGQNFYPLIDHFKHSIIILMIPYINDDTVTKPLKAGASDYIVKPFMIDELIRKIEHYSSFRQLQNEVAFYRDYFCHSLLSVNYTMGTKVTFPLIIKGISQKIIDICVVNYAIFKKMPISFISLHKNSDYETILKNLPKQRLTYVIGFEILKREDKEKCIKMLKNTPVILSSLGGELEGFSNVHEISAQTSQDYQDDILSVDEYTKTMILKFEDKYTDTELSKRLGMSRKSLWEKRKKYGIAKKK